MLVTQLFTNQNVWSQSTNQNFWVPQAPVFNFTVEQTLFRLISKNAALVGSVDHYNLPITTTAGNYFPSLFYSADGTIWTPFQDLIGQQVGGIEFFVGQVFYKPYLVRAATALSSTGNPFHLAGYAGVESYTFPESSPGWQVLMSNSPLYARELYQSLWNDSCDLLSTATAPAGAGTFFAMMSLPWLDMVQYSITVEHRPGATPVATTIDAVWLVQVGEDAKRYKVVNGMAGSQTVRRLYGCENFTGDFGGAVLVVKYTKAAGAFPSDQFLWLSVTAESIIAPPTALSLDVSAVG